MLELRFEPWMTKNKPFLPSFRRDSYSDFWGQSVLDLGLNLNIRCFPLSFWNFPMAFEMQNLSQYRRIWSLCWKLNTILIIKAVGFYSRTYILKDLSKFTLIIYVICLFILSDLSQDIYVLENSKEQRFWYGAPRDWFGIFKFFPFLFALLKTNKNFLEHLFVL